MSTEFGKSLSHDEELETNLSELILQQWGFESSTSMYKWL